jgi:hypothetical protein
VRQAEAAKRREKRRQQQLRRAKRWLGGKCMACGYTDFRVLEFDHIDGARKVDNVTALAHKGSYIKMWIEVRKCQLLCGRCHALKTHYANQFHPIHGGVLVKIGGLADGYVCGYQFPVATPVPVAFTIDSYVDDDDDDEYKKKTKNVFLQSRRLVSSRHPQRQ